MLNFNSLPNELILQIIPLLLPEDLESFSSTCRLVYQLAGKSLDEHRTLKRKYRHYWSSALFQSYRRLYGLLRAILENPRIAWYVEYLEIDELNTEWVDDMVMAEAHPESDPTEFCHKGDMSVDEERWFKKAIQECVYVSADEFDWWWGDVQTGVDDAVLALLVTLLPNLKYLELQIEPLSAPLFYQTIRRISTASSSSNSSIPLSRLSDMAMHLTGVESDVGRFIKVACLWPFFALPSMRFVMGAGIRHSELIPLAEGSSDVVQVEWTEPYDFTPDKIKNLFSIFKALQIFRLIPQTPDLSLNWDGGSPITVWNVQAIRDSLILYAKHSLEELHLCTDDLDEMAQDYIGGLRAFEVLKRIKINVVVLLGERGLSRRSLAQMLPMSIEDVTIQDDTISRKEYRSLVLNLLRVKHRSVPNLKLLSFQESFSNASVVITDDDLEKICKRAGFTLVVTRDV